MSNEPHMPRATLYLVLRCQKTHLHTSSSREGVWLEEGDHVGYFMGMELLNPGHSNPLLPSPKPNLT